MVASQEELEVLGFDINERVKHLLSSPISGSLTFVMGFRSEDVPQWLKGHERSCCQNTK